MLIRAETCRRWSLGPGWPLATLGAGRTAAKSGFGVVECPAESRACRRPCSASAAQHVADRHQMRQTRHMPAPATASNIADACERALRHFSLEECVVRGPGFKHRFANETTARRYYDRALAGTALRLMCRPEASHFINGEALGVMTITELVADAITRQRRDAAMRRRAQRVHRAKVKAINAEQALALA